jgi:hypothetical protein
MGFLGGKKKFIDKGAVSETRAIARFIQCGYNVLKPVSAYSRYDLVIEDAEGRFWRVQVKTGRWNIDKTGITFFVVSNPGNRGRRGYKGECDYFAVYFEPTDAVYLVPFDEVSNTNCTLRLEPTPLVKRGDTRMAYDYEL